MMGVEVFLFGSLRGRLELPFSELRSWPSWWGVVARMTCLPQAQSNANIDLAEMLVHVTRAIGEERIGWVLKSYTHWLLWSWGNQELDRVVIEGKAAHLCSRWYGCNLVVYWGSNNSMTMWCYCSPNLNMISKLRSENVSRVVLLQVLAIRASLMVTIWAPRVLNNSMRVHHNTNIIRPWRECRFSQSHRVAKVNLHQTWFKKHSVHTYWDCCYTFINYIAWFGIPHPDSPGLEQLYSQDLVVCEGDGRPR